MTWLSGLDQVQWLWRHLEVNREWPWDRTRKQTLTLKSEESVCNICHICCPVFCRQTEVKNVVSRCMLIRYMLREKLRLLGNPSCWNHLTQQRGLFCYIGLNGEKFFLVFCQTSFSPWDQKLLFVFMMTICYICWLKKEVFFVLFFLLLVSKQNTYSRSLNGGQTYFNLNWMIWMI